MPGCFFMFGGCIKGMLSYFSTKEWLLWGGSVAVVLLSAVLFPNGSLFTTVASLFGVTSLIFCAKGNPIGQVIMILFGMLYGIISYSMAYYGEMITYMGMTVPMACYALVCWLRHPYRGKRQEVVVNRIKNKETVFLCLLTFVVTFLFYWILKYFHTANLFWSTVSVATSFAACYLTARRSPYYALVYAMNDVVLIILWVLATVNDRKYLGVVICFLVFLVNDLYGFYSWKKMLRRQREEG